MKKNSHAGTRTRVGEVKTRYPNRLDYMGSEYTSPLRYKKERILLFALFHTNPFIMV